MKTKKSKRANLENYRTIFLQIGFILALIAILAAFEWKTTVTVEKLSSDGTHWVDIREIPPVTRPKPEKAEKPPLPSEKIVIRKDDVIIEDEPLFLPTDDKWDEPIPDFGKKEEVVDENEYPRVQIMPKFMGQDAAYFRNYIAKTVGFPLEARENGISGTVFASFVVDKDGSVIKVKILRGVHPSVDQAVLNAINKSPKWEPGMQEGRFVKVRYTIAISFKLE